MDLELAGKTFIVTGGTDGLGFAAVKCLAAEGANVLATGRTEEKFLRARQASAVSGKLLFVRYHLVLSMA